MPDDGIDPMKEFSRLRNTVEKVIEQSISTVQSAVQNASVGGVRLDIYEVGNEVVIQTNAMSGLESSSIEVSMEGDVLTIRGQTIPPDVPENASYILQERRFGIFERAVTIPLAVKSEEAKAKLSKAGVLTVTLPLDRPRGNDIKVIPTD